MPQASFLSALSDLFSWGLRDAEHKRIYISGDQFIEAFQ
jgi:hypothetical protein